MFFVFLKLNLDLICWIVVLELMVLELILEKIMIREYRDGGILVYIRDNIDEKRRTDIETNDIECIVFEVFLKIVNMFAKSITIVS